MRDQLDANKEFVRPFYETRDVAHNFRHIERNIKRLDILSEGVIPTPRLDRLYFLACFHGLGKRLHSEPDLNVRSSAFLRKLGWAEPEIQELFTSLDRHLNSPETVEEAIVHDANKIETLGAFGIAKAFTMGGIMGQTYEETADYFENQSLGKTEFRTPTGQRLSDEGRQYAIDFLGRLRREL
jgi:uncharacterized protein